MHRKICTPNQISLRVLLHLGVNLESNVERPFVVLFLTALSFSRPMSACDMGIEVLKQECETKTPLGSGVFAPSKNDKIRYIK